MECAGRGVGIQSEESMRKFISHFIVKKWRWFVRREGNVIKIHALWGNLPVAEFEVTIPNRAFR